MAYGIKTVGDFLGNQVVIQNVDEYNHHVNSVIGVIFGIANVHDDRDHQEYMAFWLYRSHKVVRVFEFDVLHHKGPDGYFDDDVHQMLYGLDWWVIPPCYEKPSCRNKMELFCRPPHRK